MWYIISVHHSAQREERRALCPVTSTNRQRHEGERERDRPNQGCSPIFPFRNQCHQHCAWYRNWVINLCITHSSTTSVCDSDHDSSEWPKHQRKSQRVIPRRFFAMPKPCRRRATYLAAGIAALGHSGAVATLRTPNPAVTAIPIRTASSVLRTSWSGRPQFGEHLVQGGGVLFATLAPPRYTREDEDNRRGNGDYHDADQRPPHIQDSASSTAHGPLVDVGIGGNWARIRYRWGFLEIRPHGSWIVEGRRYVRGDHQRVACT
jgi:hypothetical protein